MFLKMRILEILVFIQFCLFVSAKIKIKNLKIPDGIEYNTTDEVILDCDYSLGEEDKDTLVIKWFFQEGNIPGDGRMIYQWIVSRKPQIVAKRFKSLIDLSYNASEDPFKKHRALKINKISSEITGNYTCVVSSMISEDRKSKKLVVYRKAENVEFIHLADSEMYICAAYGVYPEPVMNIFVKGSNLTRIEDYDDNDDNNRESSEGDDDAIGYNHDGLLNVTSSYKYLKTEIKNQTQFICELWIPDTDYHLIFYSHLLPDNSGVIHRLSGLALIGLSLALFI
ncbi:uncharacterized protein [Onthophagus taurus]|uniref:uncharacterized protein n=1 Tax=Onthophagus taurus TaxID=166361 RepID=UPI0039BDD3A0